MTEGTKDRVLVIDDEPAIAEVLSEYLTAEGFLVERASDGAVGLKLAIDNRPDILILDLNLPTLSGVEVFRQLREQSDVPVIMLTSRVNEVDRVVGLELGADDYVGKPFSPREVVARVKNVLRRYRRQGEREPAPAEAQRVGDIEIDRLGHEVRVRGNRVNLTPMEYRILDVLANNLGRSFSRAQLLDRISGEGGDVFDRTLDRHIANLRHKIEVDSSHPKHIVTVFGVGYKMVGEG